MLAFIRMLFYCIAFTAFIRCNYAIAKGLPGSPVVLVPGDGGSQFEAMLDKPTAVHVWCAKQAKTWFPLWLNMELMAPFVLDCLVDNMRLVYHAENHTTTNSPGVLIRQPNFGNTSSVEFLDESEMTSTSYFYYIVESLVSSGYTRNINIMGAPYDFRKAPNENAKFIKQLGMLIEETSLKNGKKPVVVIGHSMGNPYVFTMLNEKSSSWKKTYIKSFVSLSGPWGGAVKTLRLMASGDNLGVFVVNPLTARAQQRSMPSSAWLLPYDYYWNDTEVLVRGPVGNYTVKDYKRFFYDIDHIDGYNMRQDTEPLGLGKLVPPKVEVHCLHGVKVDTPASFTYSKKEWYDSQPDVTFGDGDGTVNLRSLHGCLRWVNKNGGHKVYHQTFAGVNHMQILKNEDINAYIKKVVYS